MNKVYWKYWNFCVNFFYEVLILSMLKAFMRTNLSFTLNFWSNYICKSERENWICKFKDYIIVDCYYLRNEIIDVTIYGNINCLFEILIELDHLFWDRVRYVTPFYFGYSQVFLFYDIFWIFNWILRLWKPMLN